MISLFFMILVAHLTFSIFTGAFALYQIFNVTVPNAVQQCIDNGTQSASDCQTAYNVAKGVIVAIFIIVWLLEICSYSFLHRRLQLTKSPQMPVSSRTTMLASWTMRRQRNNGPSQATWKLVLGHCDEPAIGLLSTSLLIFLACMSSVMEDITHRCAEHCGETWAQYILCTLCCVNASASIQ
jgi:hypothetical protein